MKKHYLLISLFSCLALPAWALPDDDSNQTLTYAGETVSGSTEIVAGHGQQNANGNTVIITGSTIQDNNSPLHNAQVVGGWAVYNSANDNTITISNSTVNRNIVAGQSTFGLQANNNEVSITGSQVNKDAPLEAVTTLTGYQAEHRYDEQDGDVYVLSSMATDRVQAAGDLAPEASLYTIYGGTISNGEASGNQIIITDSQNGIGNNLVSAYSLYLAGSHLEGNSIQVSNSAVSGLIVGATSYAANWETSITDPLTNNNNSVSVSSSQVNDVIGAFGGLTTNGNSILLTGSTADNLYGVSFGQNIFYAGGQPQTIENTADNNSVRLYNASTVTGNIYGAQSHSVQARGNLVEIADGSSAQGNVYGTHISNARVQVNDTTVSWNTVQTAAENNTLTITGSTAGNSTAEIAGAKNLSGWANSNRVTLTAATATAATLAGGWAAHERQTLTAQGQQYLAPRHRLSSRHQHPFRHRKPNQRQCIRRLSVPARRHQPQRRNRHHSFHRLGQLGAFGFFHPDRQRIRRSRTGGLYLRQLQPLMADGFPSERQCIRRLGGRNKLHRRLEPSHHQQLFCYWGRVRRVRRARRQ